MKTFYSEWDSHAAQWLRNLQGAGLIPEGTVDERDVRQLTGSDLAGYDRVSLFSGIGGWERAFELAHWDAARPVWSVSCPCPPFSTAGRKKPCPVCGSKSVVPCPRRTGFFICVGCEHAWHADDRHLWPEVWRLIRDARPPVVFGEQVPSADGLLWLAGVRASLEVLGYGVGSSDLPAGGVGAPHKRQRLWWVAKLADASGRTRSAEQEQQSGQRADLAARGGATGGVADAGRQCLRDERLPLATEAGGVQADGEQRQRLRPDAGYGGDASLLADADGHGRGGEGLRLPVGQPRQAVPDVAGAGEDSGVGDAEADRRRQRTEDAGRGGEGVRAEGDGCGPADVRGDGLVGDADAEGRQGRSLPGSRHAECGDARPAGCPPAVREPGFWDDYALIPCTDGKSRRVESGAFPLVAGLPFRLADGRTREGVSRAKVLRGIGNSIVPEVAALFIRAFLDAERELYPN